MGERGTGVCPAATADQAAHLASGQVAQLSSSLDTGLATEYIHM